jgi:hypothetical protein
MDQAAPDKARTIRAVRKRATPPATPTGKTRDTEPQPEPQPELSNYELIERRSHELEIDRAHGGPGTPQPPDAETPLLFSRPFAPRAPAAPTESRRRNARRPTPNR